MMPPNTISIHVADETVPGIQRLTTSESLMLDIVRISASALVAFGHLTQRYFSTGWPDMTGYARGAVAVFFVLSGFVIRHVTVRRRGSFGNYMGDRLSRIYSVAIPALIFTLFSDLIARSINPDFYSNWQSQYKHPLERILVNLAFCGQLWRRTIDPLSNSPYWSINYEMAYYVGYGFFFYFAGKTRWLLIALLSLICGYRIVFLCPLWIGGCIVHDLYQKWTAAGVIVRRFKRLSIALLALSLVCLILFQSAPAVWNARLAALPHGQRLTPLNYVFGLFWLVLFMGLLLGARQMLIPQGTPLERKIRFIAEGTYPAYLFHFPLYVLIAACIPYNHGNQLEKVAIFLSVMAVAILAGHPCNLFKNKLRSIASIATVTGVNALRRTPHFLRGSNDR